MKGLRAVRNDIKQLDRGLRLQQVSDVLGNLRDIFDDEQANLVARCGGHPRDYTKPVWTADPVGRVPVAPAGR